MAYDLSRCPQTTDEFRDYFSTLTGTTLGTNANDYEAVLSRSYPWQGQSLMIPPGVGPGISQPPDAPFFGLTQQYSGGPKGRVFLPSNQPDELGYLTTCWQYLDDAAGTYSAKKDPKTQFNAKSGGLIWAWYHVAGNAYSPVQPADGTAPPASGGGLTEAQVQAMIDTQCVKYGDRIALRTAGDSGAGVPKSLLSVEEGGPRVNGDPVQLTGRTSTSPGPWETLEVLEGQG